MRTGAAGIEKLKLIEGFIATWKRDVNKLAIGYGHNEQPNDRNFIREPITKAQAEEILKKDLVQFEAIINNAIKVPLSQIQYDALILWVYNTGRTKTTLFDLINQKANIDTIVNWWKTHYITTQEKDPVRAAKLVQVLIKRRAEEAEMFKEGANSSNTAPAAPTGKSGLFFLIAIAAAYYIYNKNKK
jgi:lysozyme